MDDVRMEGCYLLAVKVLVLEAELDLEQVVW